MNKNIKESKGTKENYIEMISKAEEIQKLCKYQKGDWFKFPKNLFVLPESLPEDGKLNHPWLPTLEQLFKIIQEETNKEAYYKCQEYVFMSDFVEWITNTDIKQYKHFTLDYDDTKVCLLVYLMEEIFSKYWNGEQWEAIGENER